MAIKTTPIPTNGTKNCLEDWENDLKNASNKLRKVLEEKAGYGAKFSNASLWEGKLKMFWNCIQHTDELNKKIAGHLELFLEQAELVCRNVECSKLAISYLFCGVKDIFECTDRLKEKLADFFMKVDCLNDDSINSKTSFIIECITTIQTKLNEAIYKQQQLIKMVIEILKCANEIQEAICDDKCGVTGKVQYLIEVFPKSGEEPGDSGLKESCSATLEPCPVLPFNCDKVYIYTRDQQELAKGEKEEVRKELEEVCKEFETRASFERSLREAIERSKEVKDCK